jgi:hypothetical protein
MFIRHSISANESSRSGMTVDQKPHTELIETIVEKRVAPWRWR